jgi:hypothetical protein
MVSVDSKISRRFESFPDTSAFKKYMDERRIVVGRTCLENSVPLKRSAGATPVSSAKNMEDRLTSGLSQRFAKPCPRKRAVGSTPTSSANFELCGCGGMAYTQV